MHQLLHKRQATFLYLTTISTWATMQSYGAWWCNWRILLGAYIHFEPGPDAWKWHFLQTSSLTKWIHLGEDTVQQIWVITKPSSGTFCEHQVRLNEFNMVRKRTRLNPHKSSEVRVMVSSLSLIVKQPCICISLHFASCHVLAVLC